MREALYSAGGATIDYRRRRVGTQTVLLACCCASLPTFEKLSICPACITFKLLAASCVRGVRLVVSPTLCID